VKYASFLPDLEYFVFGSSSECYCDPDFLELETLGPKAVLEPGQPVTHQENWRLILDKDTQLDESTISRLAGRITEQSDN
jgi:hypothetical protein